MEDDHRDEVLLITLYQRYMLLAGLISDNVNLNYLAKVVCLPDFSTVNLYTYHPAVKIYKGVDSYYGVSVQQSGSQQLFLECLLCSRP